MKRAFLLLIVLLLINICFAEGTGKKPLKAAALSLFIPGGGQIYNEAYIKSGFVIAIEGSLLGLTLYHHFKSEDYYDKYVSTENEKYYEKYTDYYYKKQNDLWWLGVTVFLSTVDAYVDAHLFDFDEKKSDIHLKFDGKIIGFQYNF